MWAKIGNLGGFFGPRTDHPLADSGELRRILHELPADSAFKALDEIAGWLESLQTARDFPEGRLFDVVRQLDEAAQPHLRRLTRDYLLAPRLARKEEKRLWSIAHGVWTQLAENYERCLPAQEDGAEAHKAPGRSQLPLLAARLLAAGGAALKWECFHYGPIPPAHWLRLGRAFLLAEAVGVAERPLLLYPLAPGQTTVVQEYLKVLIFQSVSLDSLLPCEIELAEKLVAHFAPAFVFGPQVQAASAYWVDPSRPAPPARLVRPPATPSPGVRFFQPGGAPAEIGKLLAELEAGGDLPPDLNLGAQYPARIVLSVLRHLAACLAPAPPRRRHDRHRVKHRMAVLPGLANAFAVFFGAGATPAAGLHMESWVVENVSRGGFGAVVGDTPADWLKVGALLALQPEGGANWLLGLVRRYQRRNEYEARVGIQTLARQAAAVELKPRTASSYAAASGIPALWLQDGGEAGEALLLLPPASFDRRESLRLEDGGRHFLLTPLASVEHTPDYELARYRLLTAE